MYPYEVIRNSMQSIREIRTLKLITFVNKMYSENGIKAFYKGFYLNLFRILPNTAIMFCFHEYFTHVFTNKYNNLL